ncbi:alpha beta-hydrolase [Hygrophoropsis aurantiaca]|uniref:Alpha beta-hydrolase n=1 Tax=Hygrophoropsis aurantiaca TaxID=72124 RepID=A0ACB8AL56_9AGAM|nr:alpha beta-hydrolase [Hygrophoropsis aurantiaca]
MNSVYFPVQVAAFLRRLANVISTLSLPSQYIVSKARNDENKEQIESEATCNLMPSQLNWPWYSEHQNQPYHPTNSNKTKPPAPKYPYPSNNDASDPGPHDTIHRLMANPVLFDPVRAPRYPIVLCHGLYGFDVRGPSAFPSLRMHYWSNVLSILKKRVGADVIVTAVPGTGSIASRSENLDRLLQERARGRGLNLMAHSMGGLDCRHMITHVKPTEYAPLSLTTIATPHRGSPFMDWCAENIGLGRQRREDLERERLRLEKESNPLTEPPAVTSKAKEEKREAMLSLSLGSLPSSFTTLIISLLDSPAYANLTSSYLNNVFNPATPDDPRVKYFSVAGRTGGMSIWHPLWLPKMVLDESEQKAKARLKSEMLEKGYEPSSEIPPWETEDQWGNDGLVTINSARWGEFLGILEGSDHWETRGARGMEFNVDFPSVPLSSIASRVGADGWAFGDWGRFVGAWKRQEKKESEQMNLAAAVGPSTDSHSTAKERRVERGRLRERERNDPVVKASTDKLSAVFDWIVNQAPSSAKATSEPGSETAGQKESKKIAKSDLASKMDLERFYVALSRKLYDEGL